MHVTDHDTTQQAEEEIKDAPIPTRMRAIVQDRYGSPDVLSLREMDTPVPAANQILIKTAASSLNMYDVHMTTGLPYMARLVAGLTKPKHSTPGADVAGIVVEVGSAVTRFSPGDHVFGEIEHGAFADYATAGEDKIARKPHAVSFERAAATPLAGITALQGIRDVGGLHSGQRILINGASGGVGSFAVQIAKALGADVTGVCSTAKVEMVRSIGADRVIDYTQHDFTELERAYDVLFDNVGDRPWSETHRVLRPGGINVTITGPKHRIVGPLRHLIARKAASTFTKRRFTWFTARVQHNDLVFLAQLLESGKVAPVIERAYSLEQVPEALRYIGEGHALGKLVVEIS
jgi:NADPH:quinone reductase-like Zn-dependent oxidoreductase